jgi:hypothetical protein
LRQYTDEAGFVHIIPARLSYGRLDVFTVRVNLPILLVYGHIQLVGVSGGSSN